MFKSFWISRILGSVHLFLGIKLIPKQEWGLAVTDVLYGSRFNV